MGGSRDSGPSQAAVNQSAYQLGASGAKWNDIQGDIPKYHDTALQSWLAGQASVKPVHEPSMPHFEMPSFHQPQDTGPSYEQKMADQEAQYQAQLAEQQRIQGQRDRDSLYANYMSAAQSATDYVNAEIAKEQQNARLLGIDYAISDEIKSTRISDYFATVWGEGEQQQLEGLMGQWGNPTGFSGWTIQRGDGSTYAGKAAQGGGEQVELSEGIKPKLPADEEEEEVGNVLGL